MASSCGRRNGRSVLERLKKWHGADVPAALTAERINVLLRTSTLARGGGRSGGKKNWKRALDELFAELDKLTAKQGPSLPSREAVETKTTDNVTRPGASHAPNRSRSTPPSRRSSLLGPDRPPLVRGTGQSQGDKPRSAGESGSGAWFAVALSQIAGAVADELEARGLGAQPEPSPALVDRRRLAETLGVGIDTVDRLRREGCPELLVGDAPRF